MSNQNTQNSPIEPPEQKGQSAPNLPDQQNPQDADTTPANITVDLTKNPLALRDLFDDFVYESFQMERQDSGLKVTYVYKLGSFTFRPVLQINADKITNLDLNLAFLRNLFFNFGLVNAINYYKLTLAPNFVVHAGPLDAYQQHFFRKVFYHGLGEMMFRNHIQLSFADFMHFKSAPSDQAIARLKDPQSQYANFYHLRPTTNLRKANHDAHAQTSPSPSNQASPDPTAPPIPDGVFPFDLGHNFHGNLIPIGGGKDSIVTLESLHSMYEDNLCFLFNRNIYPENQAALDCIKYAGYPVNKIASVDLSFDPLLFELNKAGYYNGHVPFSALLAFASLISAYLNNKAYIVLSNEASANEGNVKGSDINHQYSKSFAFESDFQDYVKHYLTDQIYYFSLLRCLNEYQIMQKFLQYPTYLNLFRSCNVGTRENKWCGHCAKCLYVAIMLYPFVSVGQIKQIFGHDPLDDPSLFDTFVSLYNPDTTKPFDCVGTRDEINYSLTLALIRLHRTLTPDFHFPVLLKFYEEKVYDPSRDYSQVEHFFNPKHHIPPQFLALITNHGTAKPS